MDIILSIRLANFVLLYQDVSIALMIPSAHTASNRILYVIIIITHAAYVVNTYLDVMHALTILRVSHA